MKRNAVVVFDKSNFSRASLLAKENSANIICCFDLRELDDSEVIDIDNVINFRLERSYRPVSYGPQLKELIKDYFYSMRKHFLAERYLNLSDIDLLEVKDNDFIVYVLNEFYYNVFLLRDYLSEEGYENIHVMHGAATPVLLEWVNFDLLIDKDYLYSPWLSSACAEERFSIKTHGSFLERKFIQFKHSLRSLFLFAYRVKVIAARKRVGSKNKRITPNLLYVRSGSQAKEAELISQRCDMQDFSFIYDDSFRKEDCREYLEAVDKPKAYLYSYLPWFKLLKEAAFHFIFRYIWQFLIKFEVKNNDVGGVEASLLFKEMTRSIVESSFSSRITMHSFSELKKATSTRALIVFSTFDQWGGISSRLGRPLQLKTISVQNFQMPPYFFSTPLSYFDVNSVYNTYERDMLVRSGLGEDKIQVDGGLLFDSIHEAINSEDGLKGRAKYANDERLLLVAATQSWKQNSYLENKTIWNPLIEVARASRDLVVVLKLHPYELISDYKELIDLIEREGLDYHVIKDGRVEELICFSDVFITRYSSTINFAVLANKAVISIIPPEDDFAIDAFAFIQEGMTKISVSEMETIAAIDYFKLEENRLKFSEANKVKLDLKFSTMSDGCGGDRLVETIQSVIE